MYPFRILNKRKYALCFFNAFCENLCLYIMPVFLSILLTAPFTIEKMKWLIILTVLVKTLEIVFNIIWNTSVFRFVEYTKKDLQISYFRRICQMNLSRIHHIHTGYLKKQLDLVTEETGNLLHQLMMTINGFLIAITIFLFQVWTQSPFLCIMCIFFILLIVFYNFLITKKNVAVQEKYNDTLSKYHSTFVDFLQNIRIVKNFDALKFSTNSIEQKFEPVKKPLKKANQFRSYRSDGINALIYLMYTMVLIHLFFQMKEGIDVFHYVVFYSTMFSGLDTELRGVANLFIHYNKFKSANDQIETMLIPEEPQNKIRNWNTITMSHIDFQYSQNDQLHIQIPHFTIHKKEKVSIIGESGQGKSTFLYLFCRAYPVSNQNYLVNQIPTSKAPDVAYISQEADFLDLSIRENLCLGKKIKEQDLLNCLEDAGLLEWIHHLEHGLDTLVGEKGVKLSAGQRQRLNMIRGILLDKEIYILDEPTSNLDSQSEEKIYSMIQKYLKEKTVIIVTHRMKLTELCEKNYCFKNHVMEEIGSRKQ